MIYPRAMKQVRSILVITIVVSTITLLSAQDWSQWRGPARTGATAAFKSPATWPERPKQVWKVQAGVGHASPIVAANRVYLFSRIGEQEALTAFDLASGKQAWQQTYNAPYQMNSAATSHGKGPKSTPVFNGGRVYTFGISGILTAWQASDGRMLWRKDFAKAFPTTSPDFGVAMSPIVVANLLVVHVGGSGNGALTAFDVTSGQPRWSWTGDGPAYASPVVADLSGTRQIITQSQRSIVSVSLTDGHLLWQVPFATEFAQNIVTPIVVGDLVVYGGVGKPTAALRVTQTAGKWQAEQAWQNAELPLYMSSPVESGGYLFGLATRNRGQFFCLDPRTGKTVWTTKGREAENASFVTTGDLILAVTTEGEVVISRNSPKQFDLVKRYTIADSPVWAYPAVTSGGLVIKDAETLAYWTF
jgi:outer membrane protein assembly factor BamB